MHRLQHNWKHFNPYRTQNFEMAFFAVYGTYLQPVYKQNNTHFDVQNYILTLMSTQHTGGRRYTSDLHLVTTDI